MMLSEVLSFCFDIDEPLSAVYAEQLNLILRCIGWEAILLLHSQRLFRFEDVTVRSLGLIKVTLQTRAHQCQVLILPDIFSVEIPALLSLEVLDSECRYADNLANRVANRQVTSKRGIPPKHLEFWSVPLSRFDGHLYACTRFSKSTFCTAQQLRRLYRKFVNT